MAKSTAARPRTSRQDTQEKPNSGKKGARGQSEGIKSKRGSPTIVGSDSDKKPGRAKQEAKTKQAANRPVRRRK